MNAITPIVRAPGPAVVAGIAPRLDILREDRISYRGASMRLVDFH